MDKVVQWRYPPEDPIIFDKGFHERLAQNITDITKALDKYDTDWHNSVARMVVFYQQQMIKLEKELEECRGGG